ncbi:PDZ domain-containing protein [Tessaracoccus lubricantis]|uniref:PDZ domain-containing protein n=1 Tax=Tessaracoccus lubricantis TaxID=545543 RepID=A0ABP9EWD2_9ACTN
MSRNAVAIVSSLLFAALAALLVVTPVPYVAWRPGQTIDVLGTTDAGPVIDISGGLPTYPTDGRLLMTTIEATRVDASISLPEALYVHLATGSDAIPREIYYPPGKTIEQVRAEATLQMDNSRALAIVAALRAEGVPVAEVPSVGAVSLTGPSADKLLPGDVVQEVDGEPVETIDELQSIIAGRAVGDTITFTFLRDGRTLTETVTATADNTNPRRPDLGVRWAVGYQYSPTITFGIDAAVTGPSAGLIFALGIYDRITEGDLLGGRVVAGTGSVDATGRVGPIGGIREKITGAERDGAEIFLVPERNCQDIGDLRTRLTLIRVASFKEAVAALQLINEGNTAEVPTCG